MLVSSLAAFALTSCDRGFSEQEASHKPPLAPVETIVFGIYTADKASRMVERFAPVLADLEERVTAELGRPIRIQMHVAPCYSMGVEDLVEGRVQFSRLGPASFILAKEENPELKLLAMESKGGARTFKGVIAVQRDSEIEKLEDLRGTSFAFGNPKSTIGRYLAQAMLLKAGIDSSDFESFEFLERHDTVGMAVAAGEFTAGALKEGTFDSLVSDGQPLRVLATFENVTKPWVYHPSLAPDLAEALTKALLAMPSSGVSKDGFLPARESDYDTIKVSMEEAQGF